MTSSKQKVFVEISPCSVPIHPKAQASFIMSLIMLKWQINSVSFKNKIRHTRSYSRGPLACRRDSLSRSENVAGLVSRTVVSLATTVSLNIYLLMPLETDELPPPCHNKVSFQQRM